MRISRYRCCVSGIDIPVYPDDGFPRKASKVVLIMPNNKTRRGTYKGDCIINSFDFKKFYWSTFLNDIPYSGDSWENGWNIFAGHRTKIAVIKDISWDESFTSENSFWVNEDVFIDEKITSLDDLNTKKKLKIKRRNKAFFSIVKLVRADFYSGQKYEELPRSRASKISIAGCSPYLKNKIIKSLKE